VINEVINLFKVNDVELRHLFVNEILLSFWFLDVGIDVVTEFVSSLQSAWFN
jgi:Na+/H+ antiporter NhaA